MDAGEQELEARLVLPSELLVFVFLSGLRVLFGVDHMLYDSEHGCLRRIMPNVRPHVIKASDSWRSRFFVIFSSSSRTPSSNHIAKKLGDQSGFEKRLVEFASIRQKQINSPVYCLGYMKVKKMMRSNHYHIKDTLKDIVSASETILDSTF